MYGNAIIVSETFLKKNPEAVKAFLRAFTKGMKDVVADPKAAIATLKARDGLVNEELELRRLKLALDATILTADAQGRRLRRGARAAPEPDGEPGLGRLRHQGARSAPPRSGRTASCRAPPSATSSQDQRSK